MPRSDRRVSPALLIAILVLAGTAQAQTPATADTEACRREAVVMFSTSWCGYCRKARAFFSANNIDFEEIDAERTPSQAIRDTAKRNGVPYIVIGAEVVRGFNERRLRDVLCVPL